MRPKLLSRDLEENVAVARLVVRLVADKEDVVCLGAFRESLEPGG